jgi:hypothetical protein
VGRRIPFAFIFGGVALGLEAWPQPGPPRKLHDPHPRSVPLPRRPDLRPATGPPGAPAHGGRRAAGAAPCAARGVAALDDARCARGHHGAAGDGARLRRLRPRAVPHPVPRSGASGTGDAHDRGAARRRLAGGGRSRPGPGPRRLGAGAFSLPASGRAGIPAVAARVASRAAGVRPRPGAAPAARRRRDGRGLRLHDPQPVRVPHARRRPGSRVRARVRRLGAPGRRSTRRPAFAGHLAHRAACAARPPDGGTLPAVAGGRRRGLGRAGREDAGRWHHLRRAGHGFLPVRRARAGCHGAR